MIRKNTIVLLLIGSILSLNSVLLGDAPRTSKTTAQKRQEIKEKTIKNTAEIPEDILNEEDIDLDIFDESSINDLLTQIEETKSFQPEPSLSNKIALLGAYLKIKMLDTKDHLREHQNKYFIAVTCTLWLLLFINYFMKQFGAKPKDSY